MASIHSLTVVCPIFPRALSFCFDQPGYALFAIGVGPYDQLRVFAIDRNLPVREYLRRLSAVFDSFSDIAPGAKVYAETEYGAHLAWANDAPSRILENRAGQMAEQYQLN